MTDTAAPSLEQKRLVRVARERIDLGLAILDATRDRTRVYTLEEIAAYAGTRRSTIFMIEKRAIQKLRKAARKLGCPNAKLTGHE